MRTLLLSVVVVLLGVWAADARAGKLTYGVLSSDANSGISTSHTYTHAVDAGDATGVTINGVTFAPLTQSGTNFSTGGGVTYGFSTDNPLSVFSGNPGAYVASGQLVSLLDDFIYGGVDGTTDTLTLPANSLSPGTVYTLRLYLRSYGPGARNINIRFDEDGAGPLNAATGPINEDMPSTIAGAGIPSDTSPYAVNYEYTATTFPMVVAIDSLQAGFTFHFYGMTNQVGATPEPGIMMLLPAAAILMRRRRTGN
jgi:hypothetical protein